MCSRPPKPCSIRFWWYQAGSRLSLAPPGPPGQKDRGRRRSEEQGHCPPEPATPTWPRLHRAESSQGLGRTQAHRGAGAPPEGGSGAGAGLPGPPEGHRRVQTHAFRAKRTRSIKPHHPPAPSWRPAGASAGYGAAACGVVWCESHNMRRAARSMEGCAPRPERRTTLVLRCCGAQDGC